MDKKQHGVDVVMSSPEPADADPSVDKLLAQLYACISFEEGDEPDLAGLTRLFSRSAQITRITPEGVDHLTPETFCEMVREMLNAGVYTSFCERELARRLDRFGDVAHVWSEYETRRNRAATHALARGFNSIQLIRERGEWHILALFWDESPAAERARTAPASLDFDRPEDRVHGQA